MKLSFHGACREVTGSCAQLEGDHFNFLVDCGFFQGNSYIQKRNNDPFAFKASSLDFVLLTHAHLDHCGRLPKLYKDGFRGKIFCTAPTKDLVQIILDDTLKIITHSAAKNKQQALFDESDVVGTMNLIETLDYHISYKISPQLSFELFDSGHILGSASFKVTIKEKKEEEKKVIVFSGDIGNPPAALMNDPEFFQGADFVVIESTYGGKYHEERKIGINKLMTTLKETVNKHGVLLIPIFALEKVQEIIYELNSAVESHQIPLISYYLDSPLAKKALAIYQKYENFFDDEAKEIIAGGDDVFKFSGFNIIDNVNDSHKLTKSRQPKVVLAGSGMLNGGRMPRHLKQEIYNSNAQLLFVSYQSRGTLGCKLQDGAKLVRINKQEFEVKLKVDTIDCFSSHADQRELEAWLNALQNPKPKKVFIVHGEDSANLALRTYVNKKLNSEGIISEEGTIYEI